jgi:hypothetical protein
VTDGGAGISTRPSSEASTDRSGEADRPDCAVPTVRLAWGESGARVLFAQLPGAAEVSMECHRIGSEYVVPLQS